MQPHLHPPHAGGLHGDAIPRGAGVRRLYGALLSVFDAMDDFVCDDHIQSDLHLVRIVARHQQARDYQTVLVPMR